MNLQTLAQQYRGATLSKLIEKQIRSMTEDKLVLAIQGTYANFPEHFRPNVDSITLSYPRQHWFGPQMASADLSDLFSHSLQVFRAFALEHGVTLTDDQAFDMFNLAVMRISHFAHSRPGFRKQIGIKKGWFS